jgi:multimeric flavodoxin WrbA
MRGMLRAGKELPGKGGALMKALAIQTSPNTDGLTATIAVACLMGAQEAGAVTELVHLRGMNVETCRACDNGWGICMRENRCTIEDDDFEGLREQIGEADALVVSTPVYFGEVSEITKSFFDRLRRCEWGFEEGSNIRGKPVVGIAAAGGSGNGAATALVMLERYLQMCGMKPFDLITVTRFTKDYKLATAEAAGNAMVRSLDAT